MTIQSQTIEIGSRHLVGEWHYANPKLKKRLIIVCHGYQSSRANPTTQAITEGLNACGYDTLTFNFSPNTGGFDIEHQVHDVAQVVEHFKEYKQMVLLASSFGALTAAIATIQIPRITGLITLNGFFGEGSLGQEHRRAYLKFRLAALAIPRYKRIFKYFKRELRPERTKVPVLIIHSKADTYVFIRQSQSFYDKITASKQFEELQTANHGVTAVTDQRRVISMIDRWLGTQ